MTQFAQIEIVASALEAATSEMLASLIRTAYSPNIKERKDCSTAICDMQGRALSLAASAPAHLGSTLRLVPQILQRFPLATLRPGDAFLANDPYIVGVTHLNDCTVACPIFHGGKAVGFAVAVAHHSDVGGRVPGSEAGDSVSIYQEGIRIPPVQIFAAGCPREDIIELFMLNSRTPHFSRGDLMAQLAAAERGSRRLIEIYARIGADSAEHAIETMLNATELRVRSNIERVLMPGTYHGEDWLDEDGVSDRPVKLAVTVTVEKSQVIVDFSGCESQIASGKNVPLPHTLATVYFVLKMFVDPQVPINEGLFRTVKVIAPEASIVNPVAPAAVSSRFMTSQILADALVQAFGQACPEKVMAAGGPMQGMILSGLNPATGTYFISYENYSGGQGASCVQDGMDAVHIHMTNTSNLPIESTETEFPVRIERYELRTDSAGAGEHRGGLGVRRDIRILGQKMTVSLRSARQKFGAKGICGGGDGALGAFILNPDTPHSVRLPSTSSTTALGHGDVLRIETPGGGGYGAPPQRKRAKVQQDEQEQKVSAETASRLYGNTKIVP